MTGKFLLVSNAFVIVKGIDGILWPHRLANCLWCFLNVDFDVVCSRKRIALKLLQFSKLSPFFRFEHPQIVVPGCREDHAEKAD